MSSQNGLINCRKCGTLFVKASRDICDKCFKSEMEMVDKIKAFVVKSDKKLTVEEISNTLDVQKTDLEDLFEKGRLFSILPKLLIKCKFCGIEIPDEQKTGFVCQKCLSKFSPGRQVVQKEEETQVKVRRRIDPASRKTRFDFIWSHEL